MERNVITKTLNQKKVVIANKDKSGHRLRLEKKYKEAGLTKEEAVAAADKRIKIEKVLAVTAGVTVTACAAYYAKNKYVANHCDQILKAGTTFHNLDSVANERPGEHLYVNYRKNDTDFFRGQFALGKLKKSGEVHNHELTAVKDIKIPSLETRKKTFEELYNDDKDITFRKAFKEHSGASNGASANDVYKKMWRLFGDKNNEDFNVAKRKYFDALQKKGYDAVVDEWDTKRSVCRSDAPLILLNTTSESFGKMNIRQLTDKDILLAQANSKHYAPMRTTMNCLLLPHTNHFKESKIRLDRQVAKSNKNSKYIDKALSGLDDNQVRKLTFEKNGSLLVSAGKYMDKHKNVSATKAVAKIKDREKIKKYVASNIIFYGAPTALGATSYITSRNVIINRYLKEHPNTRLTTAQLNEKIKNGTLY